MTENKKIDFLDLQSEVGRAWFRDVEQFRQSGHRPEKAERG